jgi:phenylacetate-coenzyme A ligase PaaK-like adenylate-forming protein
MALNKIDVYRSWKAFDPGPAYPVDLRFAAMPALTKGDIREHFPKGLLPAELDINHGLANGEINLVDTSGTTDDRITNIWNQKWWDASERSSWKLNAYTHGVATGEHREAILANPRNVGFISDDRDLPMEKRRLARFLYLNEKTDPATWSAQLMDRMIKELDIFQPVVLEANPALLARLCRYILDENLTVFQPGVIVFTYEYITKLEYRQIKEVFNAPMASSYGTTETGYVFMECESGKFHQNSDFCRVDFQPFKAQYGGPLSGRILVTPFDNPWCYFIRFDAGDLVTLEESGQCPCGRNSGIILSSINGRKANLTLTVDGRPVTLFELDQTMSGLNGIDQYKLIQTGHGIYELHLVTNVQERNNLVHEAEQVLKNIYGAKAVINIIFDADISPEISGKLLISKALFPIDINEYLEHY